MFLNLCLIWALCSLYICFLYNKCVFRFHFIRNQSDYFPRSDDHILLILPDDNSETVINTFRLSNCMNRQFYCSTAIIIKSMVDRPKYVKTCCCKLKWVFNLSKGLLPWRQASPLSWDDDSFMIYPRQPAAISHFTF